MSEIKLVKVEWINHYRVEFFDNGTAYAQRGPGDSIAGPAAWVREHVWKF